MSIRVAINGFGRIGRLVFRKLFEDNDFNVVAINDLSSPEMLAYLLRHDSVQGQYDKHDIKYDGSHLIVGNKTINLFKEENPANLPWKELNVDVVLECTGFFASRAKSQVHLDAGAKKVLISAPAGSDLPTIVYGVNHNTLTKDDLIVSGASCTTNCLAPMAKALNDYREIRTGFMTTIHAYTGDQMILDAPHRKNDFRRARAAAINIVPNSTGAAKAIGLVIPELDGKLIGSAQRVPVPSGSITILDAVIKDSTETTSLEGVHEAMRNAASQSFGYTDEELVSSDIIGTDFGSLFDATQTLVVRSGTGVFEVRVVAWYDNESSYVAQLVRTLKHMTNL